MYTYSLSTYYDLSQFWACKICTYIPTETASANFWDSSSGLLPGGRPHTTRLKSSRGVDPYLWDWQVAMQKMLNDYSLVQALINLKIIYFDSNLHLRPADLLHLFVPPPCSPPNYCNDSLIDHPLPPRLSLADRLSLPQSILFVVSNCICH